jgi:hypothetical protein
MTFETIRNLLLLLSPIILIQLGLAIYALFDLSRRSAVHGPRWLWAVGLIFTALAVPTGIILSAFYLVWGRQVEA